MKRNKSYPLPLYFIGKVLKDSNNKFGSLKHDYYLFLMDKENSNECYAVSYFANGDWIKGKIGTLEDLEDNDIIISKVAPLFEHMNLKFIEEVYFYTLSPSDAYNIFENIKDNINNEKKKIK